MTKRLRSKWSCRGETHRSALVSEQATRTLSLPAHCPLRDDTARPPDARRTTQEGGADRKHEIPQGPGSIESCRACAAELGCEADGRRGRDESRAPFLGGQACCCDERAAGYHRRRRRIAAGSRGASRGHGDSPRRVAARHGQQLRPFTRYPSGHRGRREGHRQGKVRRVDLGTIDGRPYPGCASIGLAPEIAQTVPNGLKAWARRPGYLLWAVRQLARFHAFQLTVEEGANRETFDAVEVRIANGPFHGGIELVEDAELNSGRIIVQAVVGQSRRHLLLNWAAHLFGAHRRWGQVRQFAAASMRISSEPALPISIDGEVLASTPVVVGVKPGSLLVMAPLGAGRSPGGAIVTGPGVEPVFGGKGA